MLRTATIPSKRPWEKPTIVDPVDPVEPPAPSVPGPHYVDYTPKTLARNETVGSGGKIFTAENGTAAKVREAMVSALAWALDNPTRDVDVNIPSVGSTVTTLQGNGTGSTSTAWIRDLGSRDNPTARRIRVRPADGYGSVEIRRGTTIAAPGVGNKTTGALEATYGIRLLNVNGFTFSEIEGNESAFIFSGCSNIGWEYSDNIAYWGVLGVAGYTGTGMDITSVMYRNARIKNGDAAAISTLSGALKDFTLRTSYMAPIYIGEQATWPDSNKNGISDPNEKPHSDLIQEKGNFPMTNWSILGCTLFASYNCVAQLGGQTINFYVGGNSVLIGQDDCRAIQPPPQSEYCDIFDSGGAATFQIFNGNGIPPHHSADVYAIGNMGGAQFNNTPAEVLSSLTGLESKTGWTKVQRKTVAELMAMAPKPPSGKTLWASRA